MWLDGIECDMRTAGVRVNDVDDRVSVEAEDQGGRSQIAGRIRGRKNEKTIFHAPFFFFLVKIQQFWNELRIHTLRSRNF